MGEGLPDDTQGLLLYGIGPGDNLIQLVCTADGHLEVVTMPHVSTHEDGGSDELNVADLSGLLADLQNAKVSVIDEKADFPGSYTLGRLLWATDESKAYMDLAASRVAFGVTKYSDLTDTAHATQHENGGADELNVGSLSGLLADNQNPTAHGSEHENGGVDELSLENLSLKASGDELVFTSDGANDLIIKNVTDNKTLLTIDQDSGAIDGVDIDDHSGRHENGGSDEISLTGLSGLLATEQNPVDHASEHENGGTDEISVAGLSGLLADNQNPTAHASEHQNGGVDEISVAGLSGDLADNQDPKAHASDHANGGSDALAALDTADALSDLLPRGGGRNLTGTVLSTTVDVLGRNINSDCLAIFGQTTRLAGASLQFFGEDHTTAPGKVQIYYGSYSTGYTLDSVVEVRYLANDSVTTTMELDKDGNLTIEGTLDGVEVSNHSARHENGGSDEISVAGLSGDLADAQDPKSHASDHSDGGADEVSVQNLDGLDTPWASVTSNDAISTGWESKSLGTWVGSNQAFVWLRVHNDDTGEHGVWVRPGGTSGFTKTATAGDQSSLSSLIPAGDYGYFFLVTNLSGQIDISGSGSFNVDIDIGAYIILP